ncbi:MULTISPECIES: ABC transporter permease [Streptomyces]|uniref:Transport permease protein n=1 Tax=Streptomyces lycii TaxID=2654337 RepID=A0ABQ7FJQ7_9ACTN|nr:ABC transporter permease [Streptomyces lycii]KAF4407468.1 ABC transporter permease [Streptomyces lycii]
MSTVTATAPPFLPGTETGPRRLVRDGLLVAQRNLRHVLRVPELLIQATIQPVMFVLLFAFVFGGSIDMPGGGSYRAYLLAGIFTQIVAFGSANTAMGIAEDLSKGVVDRFRSLPMARSALLLGRAASHLVMNALALLVLALSGLVVGWRAEEGVARTLAAFGVLLFFGFAMSWVGALTGIWLGRPEVVQAATMTWLFPLTFLSNAFVPTQGMPSWLRPVAEWNPVSATAAACRELFGNPNPFAREGLFPAEHPVLTSLAWSALVIAIAAPLAVRRYRRAAG